MDSENDAMEAKHPVGWKFVVDEAPVGIATVGLDKRFLTCNPAFCDFLGYSEQELAQKTITEITYPEDVEIGMAELQAIVAGEMRSSRVEKRYVRKDGAVVWGEVSINLIRDGQGQPVCFMPFILDITERKRSDFALQEAEFRYRTLFSLAQDALFLIDRQTSAILDVNASACITYGYSREEMLRLKSTDMSAEPEKTLQAQSEMVSEHQTIPLRFHKNRNGVVFPVELSASMIHLGEREALLISIRDITDRLGAEQRLLQLSYHDELTGLYNRRFYDEELLRLDTARNLPLSFILGDVNGLKHFNDTFGHARGDELLQTVAGALKRECRADDILVRLGGDEFAVLLPKTDAGEAERLADRFRKRLALERVGLLEVSVAFGSATKTCVDAPFADVFKTAEDAMYRHKVHERQSGDARQARTER